MREMNVSKRDLAGIETCLPLCMPQILVDLLEACLEQQSLHVVAEIVMQDAALAARVIQAAAKKGSSLDAGEPVSSAVQQLGIPMLTTLALEAAREVLRLDLSEEELVFQYQLWFRARVGGIAARCLAPSVNYPYIEEAQLSGLLINLGIQALLSTYPST
jgi:HD-like signal output (HDOD) protein